MQSIRKEKQTLTSELREVLRLLLRNGAEDRLPPKWGPKAQRDRLESVLQFLRANASEAGEAVAAAGAPLSDLCKHTGASVIACNEMLSLLMRLGHVKREQAKGGKSAKRGFLYTLTNNK